MTSLAQTNFRFLLLLAVLLGGSGNAASAQDHTLFSEFRFGVLAADLEPGGGSDDGVAVSLELLTPYRGGVHDSLIEHMLNPRFHVGAQIHTDDGVNQAYAGLTWDYYFTDAIFLETSFGGAMHDGETASNSADSYGCTLNFRESIGIGVDVTESISIMVTVDHMSNADLCDENQGITNAGVRVGYRW
jgi:lipid A 3-O-deacylase